MRALLLVLWWTFVGVFFGSQAGLTYFYAQGKAPWWLVFKINLSEWYVWAALTPVVMWLARRFPIERGRWWKGVLVLLPACFVLVMVKLMADGWVRENILGLPRMETRPSNIHPNFLTFWAIVAATQAFGYYRKYRERELRASQLEARLAEARLESLRMQLHPHFLFNTLNTISALVHEDPEAADRMIAALSDLLRQTLSTTGAQEIPLRQELEFLKHYLEIQQMRFGDRLTYFEEVEPETLDAAVPAMLLQPLVENAIRHGIAPRAAPGRVELRARRAGEKLELTVRDDGTGLPADFREGLGLANTRARLGQLYGAAHGFEMRNAGGGGVEVRIEIPFRLLRENGENAQSGAPA